MGSELKSIVKKTDIVPKIDLTGLNLYFRLTYIPAPYTIYQGIKKLLPNSFITYNLDTHDYSVSPIEKKQLIQNTKKEVRFENAKAKVKDLVYESVALKSVSDVPIGTFLSGGVDSSIVSLCLAQFKSDPINTFSIGFEKKSFDETDKSQTVAKLIGSKHHEFIIGEKDLQKSVGEILLNFDEPFADSSSLPTYLVSQKTRKYVKVALTGDGGDEVFGGYNKYYAGKMNNRYINIVPHTLHKLFFKYGLGLFNTSNDNRGKRYKIKRLLSSIDYGGDYYWDIISLGFAKNSLSQYILPQYLEENVFVEYGKMASISHPSSLTDYRVIDKHISLEGDMLVKVDRTSMLNSLECRAPFLNKRIWEYTNSLPEGFLMNGWKKKHILKEAFRDQFPAGFLDKSKSGFGVPVGDWLKSSLQSELRGYINKKKLEKQGIFQVQPIIDLVSNHMSGKVDNTFKVWTFYCFQKWYYSIFQNL